LFFRGSSHEKRSHRRHRPDWRVFRPRLRQAGFDGAITGVSSPRAIADAIAVGAIDRGAPLAEAVAQADLVFLSQTIGRILDTIRHLDPLVRPDALVTDAGSTKCEIVDLARQNIAAASSWAAIPWPAKRSAGRRKRTPVFFAAAPGR
jgi:hypothetical protein